MSALQAHLYNSLSIWSSMSSLNHVTSTLGTLNYCKLTYSPPPKLA